MDKLDKWEETFEIDGMKFTVKCCKIDCITYRFDVYNKDNESVANSVVQLEEEPTNDIFVEEIVKPRVKKLKAFIVRDFMKRSK